MDKNEAEEVTLVVVDPVAFVVVVVVAALVVVTALVVVVVIAEGSLEVSTFQSVQPVFPELQGGINSKQPLAAAVGQVDARLSQKFLQGSFKQRLQSFEQRNSV
jgi:hypothetical protein